jgi:hypothetical protein
MPPILRLQWALDVVYTFDTRETALVMNLTGHYDDIESSTI